MHRSETLYNVDTWLFQRCNTVVQYWLVPHQHCFGFTTLIDLISHLKTFSDVEAELKIFAVTEIKLRDLEFDIVTMWQCDFLCLFSNIRVDTTSNIQMITWSSNRLVAPISNLNQSRLGDSTQQKYIRSLTRSSSLKNDSHNHSFMCDITAVYHSRVRLDAQSRSSLSNTASCLNQWSFTLSIQYKNQRPPRTHALKWRWFITWTLVMERAGETQDIYRPFLAAWLVCNHREKNDKNLSRLLAQQHHGVCFVCQPAFDVCCHDLFVKLAHVRILFQSSIIARSRESRHLLWEHWRVFSRDVTARTRYKCLRRGPRRRGSTVRLLISKFAETLDGWYGNDEFTRVARVAEKRVQMQLDTDLYGPVNLWCYFLNKPGCWNVSCIWNRCCCSYRFTLHTCFVQL